MPRRFFAHGELPLVLLALVAQRPSHGYELMTELSRLFGPQYRPSPGTVYPALDALSAEGLLTGRTQGERTVWRLSRSGRRVLEERSPVLAAIEVRTGVRVDGAASLDAVLARFAARLEPLAHRLDPELAAGVLDDAARDLEALARPIATSRRNR